MVTIQQAAQNAAEFARSVLGGEAVSDVRLEEVESDLYQGREVWLITLSLPEEPTGRNVLSMPRPRVFKRFVVAKESGEVLAMKIRELANAE